MGIPYVLAKGVGVSRARYFPGATKTHVKLLAEPGTLRLIGGQIHGGEGVKERCDFLAFAAKRGATLDDLAWMENIYSPPIGALFEPIAIAAQNGLAELRQADAPSSAQDGGAAAPKPASAVPALNRSACRPAWPARSSACASRPSCTCAWPPWTICAPGTPTPRPRRTARAAPRSGATSSCRSTAASRGRPSSARCTRCG
jgi:hypothetical protein